MSKVVVIQNVLMTDVGLKTGGGTNDMVTPTDARTVTDTSKTAIALTRSGPEMRISGFGRIATK